MLLQNIKNSGFFLNPGLRYSILLLSKNVFSINKIFSVARLLKQRYKNGRLICNNEIGSI